MLLNIYKESNIEPQVKLRHHERRSQLIFETAISLHYFDLNNQYLNIQLSSWIMYFVKATPVSDLCCLVLNFRNSFVDSVMLGAIVVFAIIEV